MPFKLDLVDDKRLPRRWPFVAIGFREIVQHHVGPAAEETHVVVVLDLLGDRLRKRLPVGREHRCHRREAPVRETHDDAWATVRVEVERNIDNHGVDARSDLADRLRVLGADHPATLTSRNNLAYAYESAGDLGRAIPLCEQTLNRLRVLGADHPATLTSRNNLAYANESAGDLGRAIPLLEQTLADSVRVLGADHPDTLTSRNNLAGAWREAGDLGRAIPLYEQTLADSVRVLGADHPQTKIVRGNMAIAKTGGNSPTDLRNQALIDLAAACNRNRSQQFVLCPSSSLIVNSWGACSYNPSFAAALSLHSEPSRIYPRIEDADLHRPCRITENSGTP